MSFGLVNQGHTDDGSIIDGLNLATIAIDENLAGVEPIGEYYNYMIEGFCEWMLPTPIGVKFETTKYIRNFNPDLLVTVYTHYGNNPDLVANNVIDPVVDTVGETSFTMVDGMPSGYGDTGASPRSEMDRFFEVDIIGNPAIGSFNQTIKGHKPVTSAYTVYYSSLLDKVLWHSPMMEVILHPWGIVPGVDDEGSLLDPWGKLYPRYGVVAQTSQYKAAAMVALRALDIATQPGQMHVYQEAPTGPNACGQFCVVSPATINNKNDAEFQRVYPNPPEVDYDATDIGKNTIASGDLFTSYGIKWTELGDNTYAWLIWRKYEGCMPGDGFVIAVVATDEPTGN
jgi:integrating conjugative element protein (TIGR03756 family)